MNQSRPLTPIIGIILSIGLIFGLVWGNYQFSRKNIGGEGFSIQWISIRSLVKSGTSPYSASVTNQIQEAVNYENSFTRGGELRYTSPLYSGIIVLPFALIEDQNIAHGIWLTAQLVASFAILLIGLKITEWRPRWYIFFLFSLITIFSYHVLFPWFDGGLSTWASLFLAIVLVAIRNKWNEVAGIFLGLAAIQPLMNILVIIYILFWAGKQKRRILIVWFFMTVILLSILGLFLVPDWVMQYLRLVFNFRENFPPGSPGVLFTDSWPGVGRQLGWLVTIVAILLLVIEGWTGLRKDFRHFLWTACLVIVISQWIGLPTIPGNFVNLLIPLILVAAMLTERWPHGGEWVSVLMLLILSIWEWALFYGNITGDRPEVQLNLIIPLPMTLIFGLYWVRWWAIRPKRLLLEELKLGQSF